MPQTKDHTLYAVLDIETTGGNFRKEKITEIAIILFDGQEIIEERSTLIHPEKSIPLEISRLTGITNEMVSNAPTFPEVARKIVEMTENCVLVGHNISFDYSFLREEFRQLGFSYRRDTLCTLKMSRKAFPGLPSYGLGNICRTLGIQNSSRHRAYGDARATLELFQRILARDRFIPEKGLIPLDSEHKKGLLDGIPHSTGIYFFHDQNDKVIYVGKSNDIYGRILTHFSNDKTVKGLAMKEQIHRITFEITGSETLALLRESEEIKSRMPVFNISGRRKTDSYGLYAEEDDKGYFRLSIEKLRAGKPALTGLTSKTEGRNLLYKLWEDYNLCQKLCGLYKTQYACFQYSIRQCKGACIGLERPDSYNVRVKELMDIYKPLEQSFVLIDTGRKKGECTLIFVENGVYRGYAYIPARLIPLTDFSRMRIIAQQHNRNVQQIISLALRKENYLQMIPL